MKKLSIVLAILTLAALFVMPTSAAGTDILYGTPELDGVIDEMYTLSASYDALDTGWKYESGATLADNSEFAATTYYLWDDDYIYMAVEVTDATPNHVAEATVKAGYQWQNDVAEFWVFQNDVMGQFNFDAAGYGIGVGGAASFTSTGCEGAATMTDDGYIVEVKMPNELAAGDTVKLMTQVNNAVDSTLKALVCIGGQKDKVVEYTLSDEEAYIEVVEEAPATDAAATTETATATADPITALVALAIAGAGVVVCKKNRK